VEYVVTAAVKKALDLVPASARASIEQVRRDVAAAMKNWKHEDAKNFMNCVGVCVCVVGCVDCVNFVAIRPPVGSTVCLWPRATMRELKNITCKDS
jgi:hypothetical protein